MQFYGHLEHLPGPCLHLHPSQPQIHYEHLTHSSIRSFDFQKCLCRPCFRTMQFCCHFQKHLPGPCLHLRPSQLQIHYEHHSHLSTRSFDFQKCLCRPCFRTMQFCCQNKKHLPGPCLHLRPSQPKIHYDHHSHLSTLYVL